MEKYYIIRINLNGEKEQVFEGTLEEALKLQECGTNEEDRIKLENVNSMNDLLMLHYFGDETEYLEVSEAEYRECN